MELLAVMGIFGLVLVISVPSISGVVSANRLTAAGDRVAALVATARNEAISHNTLSALVLLTHQGTLSDGRALTVLRYDRRKGWFQTSEWLVLPDGIVVDLSDNVACSFLNNSPPTFPYYTGPDSSPVRFKNTPVKAPGGYVARHFLPIGGLSNPEFPATIRLVEGVLNNGTVVYAKGRRGVNFFDIAIVGDTGLTKINRP